MFTTDNARCAANVRAAMMTHFCVEKKSIEIAAAVAH